MILLIILEDGKNITPQDLYAWSDEHGQTPKTAAPSVEDIEQFLDKDSDDENEDDKGKKEKKEVKRDYKLYSATTVGSDEVGTGDYFGPIVVTACYVNKENIPFLEELGVKDSKKLTDEKILEIVPKIIKVIPYNTVILSNIEYNDRYMKR